MKEGSGVKVTLIQEVIVINEFSAKIWREKGLSCMGGSEEAFYRQSHQRKK